MSFDAPGHLHEEFANALKAKDPERLLDIYEPGAFAVAPDGGRVTGEDAMRAMASGLIASGADMQGTARKVLINDDLALTSSSWSNEVALPDGTTTTVQGITAELSRRQPDGTWKVVIDDPRFA